MAPRAYWKGSLKLSLVSCPVALYPATTSVEKTHFPMINKETGNRLKQQMVDAETGDVVEGDQKARGYELKRVNTSRSTRKSWKPFRLKVPIPSTSTALYRWRRSTSATSIAPITSRSTARPASTRSR